MLLVNAHEGLISEKECFNNGCNNTSHVAQVCLFPQRALGPNDHGRGTAWEQKDGLLLSKANLGVANVEHLTGHSRD